MAEEEAEEVRSWKCRDCETLIESGAKLCSTCKQYEEDVASGLFDDDPPMICPLSRERCVRAFCEDYGCADKAGVPIDEYDRQLF